MGSGAAGSAEQRWALKGKLAGRAAAAAERAGREFTAECPPAAGEESAACELAWLTAFDAAFEAWLTALTQPPTETDRLVPGLVPPKRRRVSAARTEVNKKGRTGLDESAGTPVSAAVYSWVRSSFYLPEDHGRALVRAGLQADGFEFTEAEEAAWWEQKGHALALTRFKTARSNLVDAVKAGVWLAHGAAATRAPHNHALTSAQLARARHPRR